MNSKAYHYRYENLTKSKKLNEGLYKEAAKILSHRSGTEYEDIAMLDSRTGKVLVKNTMAAGEFKFQCGLTSKQLETLQKLGKEFEILHNHPNSTEPSTSDIIGLFKRELATGSTVVGHDGSVYRMEKLKTFDKIEELVEQMYKETKEEFSGAPDDLIEVNTVLRIIRLLQRGGFVNYKK